MEAAEPTSSSRTSRLRAPSKRKREAEEALREEVKEKETKNDSVKDILIKGSVKDEKKRKKVVEEVEEDEEEEEEEEEEDEEEDMEDDDDDEEEASGKKSKRKSSRSRVKLYCYCRQPYDGRFMICCDVCGEWFHGECVGIEDDDKADELDVFVCDECQDDHDDDVALAQTTVGKKTMNVVKKGNTINKIDSSADGGPKKKTKKATTPAKKEAAAKGGGGKKISTQTKGIAAAAAQDKTAQDEKLRAVVRNSFVKALSVATENDKAVSLATEIEQALYVLFGDKVDKEYRVKCRSLAFNLGDANNAELRTHVINGSIQASKLVTMSAEDLANSSLKNLRKQRAERMDSLVEMENTNDRVQGGRVWRKTHKGDELMELPGDDFDFPQADMMAIKASHAEENAIGNQNDEGDDETMRRQRSLDAAASAGDAFVSRTLSSSKADVDSSRAVDGSTGGAGRASQGELEGGASALGVDSMEDGRDADGAPDMHFPAFDSFEAFQATRSPEGEKEDKGKDDVHDDNDDDDNVELNDDKAAIAIADDDAAAAAAAAAVSDPPRFPSPSSPPKSSLPPDAARKNDDRTLALGGRNRGKTPPSSHKRSGEKPSKSARREAKRKSLEDVSITLRAVPVAGVGAGVGGNRAIAWRGPLKYDVHPPSSSMSGIEQLSSVPVAITITNTFSKARTSSNDDDSPVVTALQLPIPSSLEIVGRLLASKVMHFVRQVVTTSRSRAVCVGSIREEREGMSTNAGAGGGASSSGFAHLSEQMVSTKKAIVLFRTDALEIYLVLASDIAELGEIADLGTGDCLRVLFIYRVDDVKTADFDAEMQAKGTASEVPNVTTRAADTDAGTSAGVDMQKQPTPPNNMKSPVAPASKPVEEKSTPQAEVPQLQSLHQLHNFLSTMGASPSADAAATANTARSADPRSIVSPDNARARADGYRRPMIQAPMPTAANSTSMMQQPAQSGFVGQPQQQAHHHHQQQQQQPRYPANYHQQQQQQPYAHTNVTLPGHSGGNTYGGSPMQQQAALYQQAQQQQMQQQQQQIQQQMHPLYARQQEMNMSARVNSPYQHQHHQNRQHRQNRQYQMNNIRPGVPDRGRGRGRGGRGGRGGHNHNHNQNRRRFE